MPAKIAKRTTKLVIEKPFRSVALAFTTWIVIEVEVGLVSAAFWPTPDAGVDNGTGANGAGVIKKPCES